MIDNLYIRVSPKLAFKVLAIIESGLANGVKDGAVIDTVGNTAVIASTVECDLSKCMWDVNHGLNGSMKLQLGHQWVNVTQKPLAIC